MSKIKKEKPSAERLQELGVDRWSPWECEPSSFDWSYDSDETCYVKEGQVRVETPDGGKSDPTYKAKSRNVEDSRGTGCGVSRLEFTTGDGHVNTLQTITIPGEDLVVILCESDDDAARANLQRQMIAVLKTRGFRPHH